MVFSASSRRQRVVDKINKQFATVDEAEDALSLTVSLLDC